MILDEIQALLAGNAGVQAQVNNRVYAGTVLPRGFTLPAVLVHTVTTETDYTLQGTSGKIDTTVQFDAYAITEDAAHSAMSAVRTVLKNFRGVLGAGSVVQGTFWLTDGDMPWSADIAIAAVGYRTMAHVRFTFTSASS